MRQLRYWLVAALTAALVCGGAITWSYRSIPAEDTTQGRFDTIIVLGTPSLADGTPSPEQRSRVAEGVREYRAGVAPHLIMTGGAAHNRYVEARSMVELAAAAGVPREALLEEGRAQNTIQNIFYSRALMEQHGWRSAEVVSSPSHLPRTALILERYPIAWRTHAAPWPAQYTWIHIATLYWGEATYTSKLRWLGFRPTRFLP